MDQKQRFYRFAKAALLYVLAAQVMWWSIKPVMKLLSKPETASLIIYLETGRVVKPVQPVLTPPVTEETMPSVPEVELHPPLSFSQSDAQLIQLINASNFQVDVPALLMTELDWNLTEEQPSVLILHSHGSESYTKTEQNSYQSSGAYRTLDTQHNMVRVGQALKEALEAKGISVIHDETLHDHPSYSNAYIQSRKAAEQWLEQYPSVRLVIDLHRDAAGDSAAKQLRTATVIENVKTAQIMLVVGSSAGGRQHPNWKENFSLAAKLQAQLEKRFAGICRPISFRTERFNQDLSSGALLIEVGAAGDTLEEALAAAGFLAEGIADLAYGAVTADSTS